MVVRRVDNYSDVDYDNQYGVSNTPLMDKFRNYMASKGEQAVNAYNGFTDARDNFIQDQRRQTYDAIPMYNQSMSFDDYQKMDDTAANMAGGYMGRLKTVGEIPRFVYDDQAITKVWRGHGLRDERENLLERMMDRIGKHDANSYVPEGANPYHTRKFNENISEESISDLNKFLHKEVMNGRLSSEEMGQLSSLLRDMDGNPSKINKIRDVLQRGALENDKNYNVDSTHYGFMKELIDNGMPSDAQILKDLMEEYLTGLYHK